MATKKELRALLRAEKELLARLSSGRSSVTDPVAKLAMAFASQEEIKRLQKMIAEAED